MEEAETEDSKKRHKEDSTPASMSRQPNNPRGVDKEEREKRRRQTHPERTVPSFSILSIQDLLHQRAHKREGSQMETAKERTMQASTPHTAKKHPTNTEEAETLSKQLQEQMQEAKHMMTTMHDSMARTGQQPFVQELQQ